MTNAMAGASLWEAELYEHLTSHERNERDLLAQYEDAAEASESAAFRYLSGLIVEDEVRHHRLFRDLAAALEADVELRPEDPDVPRLDRWGPDAARVVSLTESLLERERADAAELRRLSSRLETLKDDTMWQLLVRLMEMDTAKHVAILEFIRSSARRVVR
jgi:hypothetical protein